MIAIPLFMSESQKDVTVRPQKKLFSQKTGEKIGIQRRVFAEFRKGGIPSWATRIAEETFKMGGKPPEIPASMWLSTYDSEGARLAHGWDDDEYELILAKLRSKGDIIEIAPPKVEAPWPAYVKLTVQGKRSIAHVIEKILAGIETTGVEPAHVIAFERQELNRPEVIEAVEAFARERQAEEDEAEPLIAA